MKSLSIKVQSCWSWSLDVFFPGIPSHQPTMANVSRDNSAKSRLIDLQELFNVLTDSTKYNGAKYLQVLPLSDEIKPFFTSNSSITSGGNGKDKRETIEFNKILTYDNEDRGVTEVIVLKESIIPTFANSFKLFKEKYADDEDNLVIDKEKYLTSLIVLILTPEDHKFLNVHFEQFELNHGKDSNFLKSEITLIISLLTSNLPKTNKSSSLWEVLKRLTILKFQEFQDSIAKPQSNIIQFIDTLTSCVFKSCKLHSRNYYGWSFMRFLINLIKISQFNKDNNLIKFLNLKFNDQKFEFLNDFSFFDTISKLLFNDLSDLKFTQMNYLKDSKLKVSLNNVMQINTNSVFDQLIDLLETNNNLRLNSFSILFNFSVMLIKLSELTYGEEDKRINQYCLNYFRDLQFQVNDFKSRYDISEFKLINNELNVIYCDYTGIKNINEFNNDLNFKNQLKLIEINLKILNFYSIYNNNNNN